MKTKVFNSIKRKSIFSKIVLSLLIISVLILITTELMGVFPVHITLGRHTFALAGWVKDRSPIYDTSEGDAMMDIESAKNGDVCEHVRFTRFAWFARRTVMSKWDGHKDIKYE